MCKCFVATVAMVLMGCASTQVIPLSGAKAGLSPTTPESVAIYRSKGPFKDFDELGLISLKSEGLYLPNVYEIIRQDAAAQGAHAVIDLTIEGRLAQKSVPVEKCYTRQECGANGCEPKKYCRQEYESKTVYDYLSQGTMIRSSK